MTQLLTPYPLLVESALGIYEKSWRVSRINFKCFLTTFVTLKVKECAEKAEVKAGPGGSAGAAAKPSAPTAMSTDGAKKEAPTKKPMQKQSKPVAKAGESAKPASGGGVSTHTDKMTVNCHHCYQLETIFVS